MGEEGRDWARLAERAIAILVAGGSALYATLTSQPSAVHSPQVQLDQAQHQTCESSEEIDRCQAALQELALTYSAALSACGRK